VARVCLVTCLRWPEVSESDRLVKSALEARGVEARAQPWSDLAQDFRGFDAVILRSNWDYHFAPDEFQAWLDRWESAGVHIWNPPTLVRWNMSKRYLLDLAAAGVAVVPTVILEDRPERLPALLRERGWSSAVVRQRARERCHGWHPE
jgi:glutathione synthase/RimK-type ligase-like ATP-grasp enzyme